MCMCCGGGGKARARARGTVVCCLVQFGLHRYTASLAEEVPRMYQANNIKLETTAACSMHVIISK